jgi:hypothetical protein
MKKLLSTLLTFVIAMTILTVPVMATEEGGKICGGLPTNYSNNHNDSLYSDVTTSHWAYDDITACKNKGWFSGYPDGTFRPNASITRAEAVKVFAEFLGLEIQPATQTSFYDVKVSDWYAPYLEAGKELLPVHTTIQGKQPFNPNKPITREDTVYALVKALGCENSITFPDRSLLYMFNDQNSISDSIKDVMSIALAENLIEGFKDGTIRGQSPLTRAEFATILSRGSKHGFHEQPIKVEAVTLLDENAKLEIGESFEIVAVAQMSDGTKTLYTNMMPYIMAGKNLIGINENTITALAAGRAIVGFKDENLKKAIVTVEVKTPIVTNPVEDSKENTESNAGETAVCDPSTGINAGANDNTGAGMLTPNSELNTEEQSNDITGTDTDNMKEVQLTELTNISDSLSQSCGSYIDNYGNQYNTFFDCGTHRWTSTRKMEFLLDAKYDRFKGVVYIPKGETYDGHGTFQIIGDGKVLYTSPEMTKVSRPVSFDVDLRGVNDLKIQFDSYNITLCVGNAAIYAK